VKPVSVHDGSDLGIAVPFMVWPLDGSEADARQYKALSARDAAEKCAKDDYADQEEWSIAYHVRDEWTGNHWEIRVGMIAKPSFVTLEARTIQMDAATHVLWGGKVLCADLRLRGVPREWPTGQRWISLADVADGAAAPLDRCTTCWGKAPGLIDQIRQISVRKN
jgi:hypothetical protein